MPDQTTPVSEKGRCERADISAASMDFHGDTALIERTKSERLNVVYLHWLAELRPVFGLPQTAAWLRNTRLA